MQALEHGQELRILDSARQHELAERQTWASRTKLRLYTFEHDFAFVSWVTHWQYKEKDYEFLCGLFIAFRRLAPVTIYMLTHYDREYEELQLTLCSLRMFLVKCGMITTQVQNLGLCVEGVCETRAHFPLSVDTATFPLRFRWLKALATKR